MLKRLIGYFFRGLLFIVPITVTIYVFYLIFIKIDRLLGLKIPGLGFLIAIALVTFIGFLGSNIFTKRLLHFVDIAFSKVPLMRMLYTAIKDILSAFLGEKRNFEKPVFVTLIPGSNVKVVGFVTKESLDSWGLLNEVAVYIPQSYNFAGNLIVVPKEQVTVINASSSDVMAFIVSGGITGMRYKI
jgi:uncharacterized membrane protein